MGSTIDGGLQKWRCNRKLHCLDGLLITLGTADTDMCHTLVLHNGLYIRKVQIDQSRQVDQVGNSLYGLLKNLICFL